VVERCSFVRNFSQRLDKVNPVGPFLFSRAFVYRPVEGAGWLSRQAGAFG
jgi:hypothetical protein